MNSILFSDNLIMSKRGAGSELNHDNWDQEEEPEEAGEFRKASSQQMKVWYTFQGSPQCTGRQSH